ncbi:MAG: HU family DNA-binding protein [Paludibacteraceae bacterium]
MAEEKITIVDLRKAIAKQTEIEEAQVNAFLNQLIATIKDGLRKDKLVKISGLGTFKLQWVEPRKSVNISTGEPIVIEGYQKLSFTPEQSVKERINEPYADLAPVILDEQGNAIEGQMPKADPMQKFDEQALEIKDILADLGADLTQEEPAATETKVDEPIVESNEESAIEESAAEIVETPAVETPEVEAPKVEEPEVETPEVEAPKVEEPKVETPEVEAPKVEEPEVETPEVEVPKVEEPEVETPKAAEVSSEKRSKEEKKEKPFRGWLVAIITVLSLIILLFICGLFLQNKIEEWADMLNGKIGVEETMLDYEDYSSDAVSSSANTVVLSNDSANTEAVTDSATAENGDSSALAEDSKPLPKTDFYKERIYTEFIGFETVREGSRLTWIAKKFYDNKELWVFIYEANREKIKDPSTVTVGMQLKIPALPDELSDPNNMKAQHLIKKLQEQYLNQ